MSVCCARQRPDSPGPNVAIIPVRASPLSSCTPGPLPEAPLEKSGSLIFLLRPPFAPGFLEAFFRKSFLYYFPELNP